MSVLNKTIITASFALMLTLVSCSDWRDNKELKSLTLSGEESDLFYVADSYFESETDDCYYAMNPDFPSAFPVKINSVEATVSVGRAENGLSLVLKYVFDKNGGEFEISARDLVYEVQENVCVFSVDNVGLTFSCSNLQLILPEDPMDLPYPGGQGNYCLAHASVTGSYMPGKSIEFVIEGMAGGERLLDHHIKLEVKKAVASRDAASFAEEGVDYYYPLPSPLDYTTFSNDTEERVSVLLSGSSSPNPIPDMQFDLAPGEVLPVSIRFVDYKTMSVSKMDWDAVVFTCEDGLYFGLMSLADNNPDLQLAAEHFWSINDSGRIVMPQISNYYVRLTEELLEHYFE